MKLISLLVVAVFLTGCAIFQPREFIQESVLTQKDVLEACKEVYETCMQNLKRGSTVSIEPNVSPALSLEGIADTLDGLDPLELYNQVRRDAREDFQHMLDATKGGPVSCSVSQDACLFDASTQ